MQELFNEYLTEIITGTLSIIITGISLVITIIKTRQKEIENKVNKVDLRTNLRQYFVFINGKKWYLNEIDIYKDDKMIYSNNNDEDDYKGETNV